MPARWSRRDCAPSIPFNASLARVAARPTRRLWRPLDRLPHRGGAFPGDEEPHRVRFAVSPVNQGLARELHEGGFLATQRNAVLIGGTGTGKSHLAIAIGANCVRNGARVRFFTAVDLVN
jgi:hypothetical protein